MAFPSLTRRHSAASPSVSLEKGAYRLRGPAWPRKQSLARPLPTGRRGLSEPSQVGNHQTQLAILTILLGLATISSFGAAYYLYTTRWAHLRASGSDGSDGSPQVVLFDASPSGVEREAMGENDRFLSYLPHSGFNNQRIALENALVLSRMLNRTLLLPPARLGNKPLPYMEFEKLSHFVSLSGKERARRCASIPTSAPVPLECFDYTLVSWYSLMNLSSLQSEQNIFERWDLSAAWLERIGVTQDDIYTLAGSRLYHYRFVDSKSELSGDQKYTESVNIADLAQVPSRLIQIGTLFGSSRLRLRQPGNLALRGDIRRRMTLSNVLLHRIAADIGDAMGGVYLAAHVRVGDGVFSERQHHNARRIWWKLLSQALEFDNERISALENRLSNASWHCTGSIPVISPDPPALKVPRPALSPMPSSFRPRYSCHGSTEGLFDPRLAVPLFVSTDAPDPANHALIRPLMSTFPCTFFLSDFTSELAPLDPIQNPYDGAFLKPFLLPLIEAIIAGKARYVVGTDGSTFSAYVQDVLWRAYHDWEIVQRG